MGHRPVNEMVRDPLMMDNKCHIGLGYFAFLLRAEGLSLINAYLTHLRRSLGMRHPGAPDAGSGRGHQGSLEDLTIFVRNALGIRPSGQASLSGLGSGLPRGLSGVLYGGLAATITAAEV